MGHSHAMNFVLSHNHQFGKEGGFHLLHSQSSNQAFREVHPSLQSEAQQADVLEHIQRMPQGIPAKHYDLTIERLVCYGVYSVISLPNQFHRTQLQQIGFLDF